MLDLEIVGEHVQLSAQRALYLPNFATLVVADLHWGKAATFRAKGVPLPGGVTSSDLERLSVALTETSAKRLVIVGDLLHARAGRAERTLNTIADWRTTHSETEIVLVRGNHDSHAGDPPASLGIECVDGPLMVGSFACQHHPGTSDAGYVLAGHLHPHVKLHGRGRQSLRLPCFVFREGGAILPAFTSFTGGGAYTPELSDRAYAIVEDEIIPASASPARSVRSRW